MIKKADLSPDLQDRRACTRVVKGTRSSLVSLRDSTLDASHSGPGFEDVGGGQGE
jgi:hypothetical protein